jgi:transcriptional regulator with XRE-family HTH domain
MKILLEAMRKKRGWSQAELAQRSGVPQPMISEIERGVVKYPRIDTVTKLALSLRCAVEDLVSYDEKEGA